MNPDLWELDEDWQLYNLCRSRRRKSEGELDAVYTEEDMEDALAYEEEKANRWLRREEQYMRRQYEEDVAEVEKENEELRKKLIQLEAKSKKIAQMEELLEQYELYSEIEYDRVSFTLIGV